MKNTIKTALLLNQPAAAILAALTSHTYFGGIPACTHPQPDPCILLTEDGSGEYFVSSSKYYSVRCGPYDCAAMARIYHQTRRIPAPIAGEQ